MLRLKKVSCIHSICEGKEDLPMSLAAQFDGGETWTDHVLRITLSPNKEQKLAWQTLEAHLRRGIVDSMKPLGYHCPDVKEFYQDDPTEGCTCWVSVNSFLHTSDCPLYRAPR